MIFMIEDYHDSTFRWSLQETKQFSDFSIEVCFVDPGYFL